MKKILAMLLALAMALSLFACGSGGGNNANDTPNNDNPGTEDTQKPDDSQGSQPSGDKIDINVIAAEYGQNTKQWWADFQNEFNAAYDNINLTVEVVSWNDIYTVVNTRITGHNAPDILNIDVFASYVADDLLLPAKDYVSEETYAKFYDAFLQNSVIDDTVWAIPDLASVRNMYYNQDILTAAGVEKAPTTWAELEDACAKIKAYDSSIYPWGVDMTTDEGQAAFSYYIYGNNGGFIDADENWVLNSDANVEALEYVIGLYNNGYTNTDPSTETRYALQDMFGAGKVAMMIGPNQIPTYIKDSGFEVNYGVTSIPTKSGNEMIVGIMDRFMCFDNNHSDEKIEAIKTFFDYFYDDERYSNWVDMEGFLPATSTGGDILGAKDPILADMIATVGSAKFYPTAKTEWDDVKLGCSNYEQQMLLGGNVKELMDQFQAEIAG